VILAHEAIACAQWEARRGCSASGLMVDASTRLVLFAAIASGAVGALGEGAPDPSHLITSKHIGHATVLGQNNPWPQWAPVLMASNMTFGGVGCPTGGCNGRPGAQRGGAATVDRYEVPYNTNDIFCSNLSVLSMATVLSTPWYNRGTEMDSMHDITTRSLPAFYSLPAFNAMTIIGGGASGRIGGLLRLREGTPDEIALEELFDACKIGDADIKYSFPYDQTNLKEDPRSGEKGGVPLRWVECLDGALVLFRLGLLIFAVCSEQERSGPNKSFTMWARRNRSYRNKWRCAIWARHNRSYRIKWFKLALFAFLVPRVSGMATTTTTPPDGHGTGAYQRDGTGAHQAESGTHMAESGTQMPPPTPLCADDVDSGAFDSGGAPMPCSYFSAQPSACASYSIARASCPVACDTCSPLLPWLLSHTRPPPSPPPLKATPTSSLYPPNSGQARPRSSSLPPSPPLLLLQPLPPPPPPILVPSSPPPWSPLMALACTVLPCTEASDVPGVYRGLQLAVPSHRRELQTQVSTSAGLLSALANTAVGRIVLAPGTYNLTAELSITRSVILEAAVAGSVILNAQASSSSQRRVVNINPGSLGVVQLIGLNITGGYLSSVRALISHRPDGKIADVLASTHACTLRPTLRSTTGCTCRRDLQCFPSPRWENALLTCPFRFSSFMMGAASNYQDGVRASLKLQKFPSPRWEIC